MELISKASMYSEAKKKALEGAFIERFHYSVEKRLLNKFDSKLYPGNTKVLSSSLSDDGTFHCFDQEENEYIEAMSMFFKGKDNYFHYFDQEENEYIETIFMFLKREGNGEEDILLSSSEIDIIDSEEQNLCVPFEEVKDQKDVKLISFNDKNIKEKFDCNILTFSITTNVETVQDDTHSTIRTYSDMFKIPVDCECYISIVQCADGTLPIILVSETNYLVEDIEDLIFEGNIKKRTYNSYFHPHNYQKQQIETIENVVYGKPYDGMKKMEFEENIIDDKYITNDKLSCQKDRDGNVRTVFLDEYNFATYRKDECENPAINESFKKQDDILSIDLIDYIDKTDPFNSLNVVSGKVSLKWLKKNYHGISDIISFLSNINEDDERFELLDIDDPNKTIVRFENFDGSLFIHMIINLIDKNTQEVFYKLNDRLFYTLYCNGYRIDISQKEDEEGITVYTATPRRIINKSRDCTLFTFKENYWINVDNSNHIINTNLPIEGKIEKYNMFGIPESF